MKKIETEDIKELFAEWGLWSLIDDISPDGDGHGDNLQLTKEGLEAERMINLLLDDQSHKQPKGETIRNYNPEKRWDKYKKSKIEVREFDLVPKVQPEKQEEWREKIKQMVLTDCFKDQPDIQGYIDFIEQLLSEREKELLEWVISEEDIPQNVSSLWASLRWFEIYKEAHKRLSKLLKEKENEEEKTNK